MRIIIDTNIVISGAFFSGIPKYIIEAVGSEKLDACVTEEILCEYEGIIERKSREKNII